MTTQRELGDAFARGAQSGSASNVKIVQDHGGTMLVGYGHAVYAFRYPSGKVVYFDGWRGYSMSTACQLSKLGLKKLARDGQGNPDDWGGEHADVTVDAAPSTRQHTGSGPYIGDWLDTYNEPWLDV